MGSGLAVRARHFVLDAFSSPRHAGNPAAVLVLDAYLPDTRLQDVAARFNFSETAFVVPLGEDFRIRWFTPRREVPLCGHATMAAGAVVMERLQPGRARVVFDSASGPLKVSRSGTRYCMDFPVRPSAPVEPPPGLEAALGARPIEVRIDVSNYTAVLASPQAVQDLRPDLKAIAALDRSGVVVTARDSGDYDFVSRYFAPAKGIDEDPVTGGAHCMLAPYWAQRLGKVELRARQASARGGELTCRHTGSRVELAGACRFTGEGEGPL